MRNEDLKNKLDQRPVNFDRDALWDRIEAEDQDDRPKFIWWWIGAILIIGAIGLLVWSITKVVSEKEHHLINDPHQEVNEDVLAKRQENEYKSDYAGYTAKEKVDNEEVVIVNGLNPEKKIKQKSISNYIDINQAAKNKLVQKKSNTINRIEHFDLVEHSKRLNIRQEIPLSQSHLLDGSDEQSDVIVNETIKAIKSVDLLPIIGLDWKKLNYNYPLLVKPTFRPSIEKDHNRLKKNRLAIGIILGTDNHSFQEEDSYQRNQVERNLESIGLSLQYRRLITAQWSASIGIDYISNSTGIKQAGIIDSRYVRDPQNGKTYITTTQTNHELYNSYKRIEAIFQIGYSISLGPWQFTPFAGGGTGLQLSVDGDVIKDDGSLESLSNLFIYKDRLRSFASAGLSVERLFNQTWTIGLDSRFTTRRSLTNIYGEHTILPISTRVCIGYNW